MVEKNLQQSTEFFTPKLGFDVHPYILVNNKQGYTISGATSGFV